MKIVVCVKQTFDTEARIEVNTEGKIIENGVKKIMNPYDEYAVEEAIKIKELSGAEVTVVNMGSDEATEAVRQALAMGADKAVMLNDPAFLGGDEFSSAKVLAKAIEKMEYDLILAGWVAIDDGSAQTAGRIAEILNIPQATVVTKLEIGEGKVQASREIDGGVEVVEVPLPAMITVQKGINEPRYPSLKGIMQAKKKEIKTVTCADLGLMPGEVGAAGAKASVGNISLPAKRSTCKVIEADNTRAACGKLVEMLRNEAKAI